MNIGAAYFSERSISAYVVSTAAKHPRIKFRVLNSCTFLSGRVKDIDPSRRKTNRKKETFLSRHCSQSSSHDG
jgi:hypothetical protein